MNAFRGSGSSLRYKNETHCRITEVENNKTKDKASMSELVVSRSLLGDVAW